MGERTVGHARTTVCVLMNGHIMTRREQSLMLGDEEYARVVLVIEEDAAGQILRLDQRRRLEGGDVMRLRGTVRGDLLVADVDGERFEVPWDAAVRGPAYWRGRRAEMVAQPEVGSTYSEIEFDLDAAGPMSTEVQVVEVADGLVIVRASSVGLPEGGLTCWVATNGDIIRSSLELPSGPRTTERCDLNAAVGSVPGTLSLASVIQIRDGVLRQAELGITVAAPDGYRWFDWSGWGHPELEAWARGADGRNLSVTTRRVGSTFVPADLADALGDRTVLGVQRQAGGHPAFIGKQGQEGTWGLAVLVRPHLLLARVDGSDDAAMKTLLEFADALELPDAESGRLSPP
jgi:hypothetical protein